MTKRRPTQVAPAVARLTRHPVTAGTHPCGGRSGSSRRWRQAPVLGLALGTAVAGIVSCRGKVEDAPPRLGRPCVPADEYRTSFAGYDEDEVSLDADNPACGDGGVCLVNHFRGRVSCPYGQVASDIAGLPGDDPRRCVLPNTTGETAGDGVVVPVRPQLEARRPDTAVYCSCRCANAAGETNDGGDYCRCGAGYTCEPLVDELGLGPPELAGSYCVKAGTAYTAGASSASCDRTTESCGPERPVFDVPPPDRVTPATNVFVEQLSLAPIDKLDLLLMVDNSIDMAEKTELFASAVPGLLTRLIEPYCRDQAGATLPKVDGVCPAGTTEAFAPITDLHVGVLSSSLGGHGGSICSPALGSSFDPAADDRGELIAGHRGLSSYGGLGFIKWDARQRYSPPGEGDLNALVTSVAALIRASGEGGCGYEAGLESWYRFLLDPQPPGDVSVVADVSTPGAVNTTVLEQRAAFLRPDSVVVIAMLTDENDCSLRDEGLSWLVTDPGWRLPRATEACRTDPNSACCRSCALAEVDPPEGCSPVANDPHCALHAYETVDEPLNLRCFDQKRRFGIDFLYPTGRYVDALKLPTVLGRPCVTDADCPSYHPAQEPGTCSGSYQRCEYTNPLNAANPTYPDAVPRTDAGRVFLAGIVGVPWQDLATPASATDPDRLEYLAVGGAADASLAARWDVILGDPVAGTPPTDPFMVESIDPRSGANPLTGDTPQPPSAVSGASPINGHEYTNPSRDDLQYACTFPLAQPLDCATHEGGCDCRAVVGESPDRPLCQVPGTTTSGTTQYFGKAYPGLRYLDVLRQYGGNSIVASTCPKIMDPTQDDYGYGPALDALLSRVQEAFAPGCLPRPLVSDGAGGIACRVVEVTRPSYSVACEGPGREPAAANLVASARAAQEDSGQCGSRVGQTPCADLTVCALLPATGAALEACLNTPDALLEGGAYAGFCYIDAMQDGDGSGAVECARPGDPDCQGNPDLVMGCAPTQRRLLRFVTHDVEPAVPFAESTLFIACQGSSM